MVSRVLEGSTGLTQYSEQSSDEIRLSDQVANEGSTALGEGEIVPGGPYVVMRLLYQRPRLRLYLGRRIYPQPAQEAETLVAIRELLLNGLSMQMRAEVEAAAFEEFVAPGVADVAWLPTAGDRIWSTGERHFLVMQLQGARCDQGAQLVTLEELLLEQQQWPAWLSRSTVLMWVQRLCNVVARLHRMGGVLGDLSPTTILVDRQGTAAWAPLLLVSWPPAVQFWRSMLATKSAGDLCAEVFPLATSSQQDVYSAPEVVYGVCDERADVYSLGAILYTLVTRYAPIAASRRLYAAQCALLAAEEGRPLTAQDIESLDFISLQGLDSSISLALERVLLCALDPDPDRRYASVADLLKALEVAREIDEQVARVSLPEGRR